MVGGYFAEPLILCVYETRITMNPIEGGARQPVTVGPNPGTGHLISLDSEAVGNKPASERTQPRGASSPNYEAGG